MQKRNVIMAATLMLLALSSRAQQQGREITGFSNPESVIRHGEHLFVSNLGEGLEPTKKDGNGFISKVNYKTGKIEELHFLPLTGTLHAPKGSAFIGEVLYVADIDRVIGFDIVTRKTVFEFTVPGTAFLNDMVVVKGKLLLSATDNGNIYELDIKNKTVKALPITPVPGANGLCYDPAGHKLYCTGLSKDVKTANGGVYEIDLEKAGQQQIPGYEGLLDGVAVSGGYLYFSDWRSFDKNGVLVGMDLKSHSFKQVKADQLFAGPADFKISADQQYFIIPVMMEGKLLFQKR